jgi:Uma2 family endonuclease
LGILLIGSPLGVRRFIGSLKQPTIFIHELVEEEYPVSQFMGYNQMISLTFPELSLTANQIFEAGK